MFQPDVLQRTRAAQREFETQLQEQQNGIQEAHNQDKTHQEEEPEEEQNKEEPTQNGVEIPGLNPVNSLTILSICQHFQVLLFFRRNGAAPCFGSL